MSTYTPTPAWSTSIPIPDDTITARAASSVNAPMCATADNVQFLYEGGMPATSIGRAIPLIAMVDVASWLWDDQGNLIAQAQTVAAPLQVDWPHGCEPTGISCYAKPTAGHANVPGTPPTLKLYETDITTGVTTQIGATATDAAASGAVYDGHHALTISISGLTVDKVTNRYTALYTSEGGSDYAAGLKVFGLRYVAATSTTRDPGAA